MQLLVLKRRFKEYFTFTKRERNGIIMLLVILLFTVALNAILSSKVLYPDFDLFDEEFKKEVELFEKSLEIKEGNSLIAKKNTPEHEIIDRWVIPEFPFTFDPNSISKDKLTELGLSKKQINNLIKYRGKGGVFHSKKDLLKIYGIDKKQFEILEPYILIDSKDDKLKIKEKVPILKEEDHFVIEINNAREEDLIKIKGIGKVFAQKIIRYRNSLGGFAFKDQLLEVKGIDTLLYLKLENNISIDTCLLNKIDLNNSQYTELIKHPYLSKYEVQSILKYKKYIGKFSNFEQIIENNLIQKNHFFKLKPYLKIE